MEGIIRLYDKHEVMIAHYQYNSKAAYLKRIEYWKKLYGPKFKSCILGFTPFTKDKNITQQGVNTHIRNRGSTPKSKKSRTNTLF